MRAARRRAVEREEIAAAWQEALEVWGVHVSISPPQSYVSPKRDEHWPGNEPLAYIDLRTRQVVIHFTLLKKLGAWGSLTGVLAHELGHHIRFPHTLGLAAELEVLQHRLLPGLDQSLTNLFFDLQVNEVVGRTLADQLCAVYRGFAARGDGAAVRPLFGFYLAVYEALWRRPRGDLLPAARADALEERYGGFRGDARMFVQTFYELTGHHLQFAYFCSRFARYLEPPDLSGGDRWTFPLSGDVQAPDPDDFAGALAGGRQLDRALEEARDRGWMDEVEGGAADPGAAAEEDPLAAMERIARRYGRPGTAQAPFQRVIAHRIYRRLVERHLLDVPSSEDPPTPEPYLPTSTVEWEPGDDPRSIDWTQSVLARGPLAGVLPVRRELEPDEPSALEGGLPSIELYLDTSGSMPNPITRTNAMTLAAQVLSASAIRKGGRTRGIVYSSGAPLVSEWMYDEEAARDFLLRYAGGGTDYPVGELLKSSERWPDAIRVVISDSDYLWNFERGDEEDWIRGVERCQLYVAMLCASEEYARQKLAPLLKLERFRLVIVRELGRFGQVAADLSRALFDER